MHTAAAALNETETCCYPATIITSAPEAIERNCGINGIPDIIDRQRNPLWARILEDRIAAGLITDGIHLPEEFIKAVIKDKGINNFFAVSPQSERRTCGKRKKSIPLGGVFAPKRLEGAEDKKLVYLNPCRLVK
ncbi:MAG: hypothetical protein ACLFQK_10160 [Fibrobacterota bacterium]